MKRTFVSYVTDHNGNPITASRVSKEYDAEDVQELYLSALAPGDDTLINWAADVSQLSAFKFLCSRDLQIETNAVDATGGQTIQLKAGIPFEWQKDSGITNPLTLDITKLYATLAAGDDATLFIEKVADATP